MLSPHERDLLAIQRHHDLPHEAAHHRLTAALPGLSPRTSAAAAPIALALWLAPASGDGGRGAAVAHS